MKKHTLQSGFTLVEMLVAVMILMLAVTALLSVSAGSSVSVRSVKNKMTANWLAQASLDYVRNTRDTALIANIDPLNDWWTPWVANTLTLGTPGTKCFSPTGCYVNIPNQFNNAMPLGIEACLSGGCPILWLSQNTGYSYASTDATQSPFRITLRAIAKQTPNIIEMKATVTWVEGTQNKSLVQSIILTNWSL